MANPLRIQTLILVAAGLLLSGCVSTTKITSSAIGKADGATDPVCAGTVAGTDLLTASIADLQAGLASGTFTSVDLVKAYIQRIQTFDDRTQLGPVLNGVRMVNPHALEYAAQLDAERAAGHVRGPLHGIPILMKDNIGTVDMPTTAGSISLESNVPRKDAGLVAKVRENGAIVMGKLELLEWANYGAPTNGSSMGGPQHNAYNGGSASASSSGPGVAASMAYSAITLGSETDGSILGPTAANGIMGLKTSHGLVSGAGVIPIAHRYDVVGPMGRNVYDLAVTLGAMAGTDPDDPYTADAESHIPPNHDYTTFLTMDAMKGVRIGYDPSDTDALFAKALDVMRGLGAVLVPINDAATYQGVDTEEPGLANEFHHDIDQYLQKEANPNLPFKSWLELMLWTGQNRPSAHGPLGADGEAAAAVATPGSAQLADASGGTSVKTAQAAVDKMFTDNNVAAVVSRDAAFIGPGASAGYPTVEIPLGYNGNRPVAISWFGQQYHDGPLLGYAYAYEQATHARVPPDLFNAKILGGGLCPDPHPVDITKLPWYENTPTGGFPLSARWI